jgi:hypothetical protein
LALIPSGDQALGILKDLRLGRAAPGGLFLGSLPALILHLTAVKAHNGSVASTPGVPLYSANVRSRASFL